jgi:NAD(P)-dependent dehydrogenase (short-subunit alcohol dehydrogenase family)
VLTVDGDIADPATADRIIGGALERFGRIDTLVNNVGVYISKLFTDYTAEDYALMVGVNLTGFFWLTQRAIAEMLQAVWRRGGQHLGHYRGLRELQLAFGPGRADQGRPGLGHPVTRRRVRLARCPVNAVSPGVIQTPVHPADSYEELGGRLLPLGRVGQVSDVVDGILFLEASPYITGEILLIDGGQIAGH